MDALISPRMSLAETCSTTPGRPNVPGRVTFSDVACVTVAGMTAREGGRQQ